MSKDNSTNKYIEYSEEQLRAILEDYNKTKKENERLKGLVNSDIVEEPKEDNARLAVSKKPMYFIMGNSKLSNDLTKYNQNKKGNTVYCNVNPSGIKKNNGASVFASLKFDSEGISLPSEYTPYDREVFNTVCSLFEAGNTFIWPEQIYRTMTGKTKTERVSPQSVEMIIDSIKKQMTTIITVDATKQFEDWHIHGVPKDKNNKIIFYGNMLYLEGFEAIINGQHIAGWKRVTEKDPILLEYNKLLGQVITVPLKLLDTNAVVKNTPEIIILKNYLIREIERMKNSKSSRNNIVSYKTIFDTCQIDVTEKVKRKRLRDSLQKILLYWKERQYIVDFEERKKGKLYDGIIITAKAIKS